MRYYFQLQFIRLSRRLNALGIPMWLGMIVGVVGFYALSALLFYKTSLAKWIYFGLAMWVLWQIGHAAAKNQLRRIFSRRAYFQLRLLENGLYLLPFHVFFWWKNLYFIDGGLWLAGVLLAFAPPIRYSYCTIPTPFRRYPLEFIVGFRKTYWVIAGAYFLQFKALQVDNYALGLFGMAMLFFLFMSYYQRPEPRTYVWIYHQSPAIFLRKKIITALVCSAMLSSGSLALLWWAFPQQWLLTAAVAALGLVYVSSMVLAKYAVYPHEMNIAQGLLYAISLVFPPLLLVTLWIFYRKAKERLEMIVAC